MEVRIDPQWKALIGAEFEKEYFAELVSLSSRSTPPTGFSLPDATSSGPSKSVSPTT